MADVSIFSNLVLVVSEVGEEMKNHFKSLKQYKVRGINTQYALV